MGYKNQICVDFSTVVVQAMSIKHQSVEGITWKQADVRCMDQIPSESVDIAFDKGTLDAMIHGSPWDPPDEVLQNTSRYVGEVRLKLPIYWLSALLRESNCSCHLGLSCPQTHRHLYLRIIPPTSLSQTSSQLSRSRLGYQGRHPWWFRELLRLLWVCPEQSHTIRSQVGARRVRESKP